MGVTWNRELGDVVEIGEIGELEGQGDQWCNLRRIDWEGRMGLLSQGPNYSARREDQSQEWKMAMRRIANDVRNASRIASGKYERVEIVKDASRSESKQTTNVRARDT